MPGPSRLLAPLRGLGSCRFMTRNLGLQIAVDVARRVPLSALPHALVGLPCVRDKLFESLGGLDLFLEQSQHECMWALSCSLGEARNAGLQSLGKLEARGNQGHDILRSSHIVILGTARNKIFASIELSPRIANNWVQKA